MMGRYGIDGMGSMRDSRMWKSKRAVIFNIFIVIMTIIALVYAYILLADKADNIERKLGVTSMELIMRYQDGDKVLSFIDQSGEISLRQVSYDIQEQGGVDSAKCGTYFGFGLWNDETEGCMPSKEDIYDRLKEMFSEETEPRIKAYPAITFLRYYIGSPVQGSAVGAGGLGVSGTASVPGSAGGDEEFAVVQQGATGIYAGVSTETKGLIGGLVDIPQDDKIRCEPGILSAGRCKFMPDLLVPFENIKNYLEPGERIEIDSATRNFEGQKYAFVNKYIKNKYPPACGPSAYRQKIYDAIGEPPGPDDAAYHAKVDAYIASHPEIKAGIEDISNYAKCPHIIGRAIDINLYKADGKKGSDARLREIMCKADWVNYGKEGWHYEYGTGYWDKERPDQVPDSLVGSTSTNNYHQNCYYSSLVT